MQDPDSNWGHLHSVQCSPTELSGFLLKRDAEPTCLSFYVVLTEMSAWSIFNLLLLVPPPISAKSPFVSEACQRWLCAWAPWSSKSVAGRAERAAVGSTPIHSRLPLSALPAYLHPTPSPEINALLEQF